LDIQRICTQLGISPDAAIQAIGGLPMKLAIYKAEEHLKKRMTMQTGNRMFEDHKFVEDNLEVMAEEMKVAQKAMGRLLAKIGEQQARIRQLEANNNA